MTNPIADLAGRLTEAQRRAVLGARGYPASYLDDTPPVTLARLSRLGITDGRTSRLTPLGLAVKHLLEQGEGR